jgi:SAM-dependent methyltransferase
MNTTYDDEFFAWVAFTARRSARGLLPIVIDQVHPRNVLDVGCGQGGWLAVWAELGVTEYLGIDGAYINQNMLVIPRHHFRAVDLTNPWHVNQRFDLVQSLEVAEHLPPACASTFIKCLCAHSDIVLFSAAQPGQGGEHHINERNPSYWAELFSEYGYAAFDCIRPLVARDRTIDPWYRFNPILYANAAGMARLSPHTMTKRVANLGALKEYGDFCWQMRRAVLRPMPETVVTVLSRLRYRLAVALFDGRIGKE